MMGLGIERSILGGVFRQALSEVATSEQRPERHDTASYTNTWGNGRGNSKCKKQSSE